MANQTNSRYKKFMHQTLTVGDESQFNQSIPRREVKIKPIDISRNLFVNTVVEIDSKYFNLTSRAVYDTFTYLFYKFSKAIFVSIIDGKLQTYLPFVNARYRNEWSYLLKIDRTKYNNIKELLDKASNLAGYRPQKFLPLEEWTANDSMFRYDISKQIYDGHNILIIKDMFTTLCEERDIPDIELFINKRDFPLLKQDNTEPYENLYGSRSHKLVSHNYDKYAPILSCSVSYGFADVLMPTYEDWARAKYQRDKITLPPEYKDYPELKHTVPWILKKNIAVFRGSSTGSGVTSDTNQRLKALELAEKNPTYLDVGFVKWNTRVRKHISSKYLQIIDRQTYPTVSPISLQNQTDTYKYILTLEGHVAAYRLSYELSSGSLIILAESKWMMWYSNLLQPFVHYVPVKNDLSDLIKTIEWCRNNDDKCQKIVANAQDFYNKYLGVDGILDYLQKLFIELSGAIGGYSWLPDLLSASLKEEKIMLNKLINHDRYLLEYKFPLRPGPRCIGKLIASCKAVQRTRTLDFVRGIFSGKNTKIECVKSNGIFIAKKTVINDIDKKNEQCHEIFIGTFAINFILRKCPNFAYTYGYKAENDDITYFEYIDGPTLSQWIISNMYNEKDLLNILCAINLGLELAQNYCAFVHYDLTPWNIIIQTLSNPVSFDYVIGSTSPLRYTYNIVPIMIDYGKSRAVIYEKSSGLVDRGYINLFKSETRAVDTLTLIYSTINCLIYANKPVPKVLYDFLQNFKLPHDVKLYVDAWQVIKYVNEQVLLADSNIINITPLTFIRYISSKVPFVKITPIVSIDYKPTMSRGHAVFEENFMDTGDYTASAVNTVNSLYRQTIPTSDNALINKFIKSLITTNITNLDEIIDVIKDNNLKKRYNVMRRRIMTDIKKNMSTDIIPDFPIIPNGYLKMDAHLTPEELNTFLKGVLYTEHDWISIYSMCIEVAVNTPFLDIFELNTSKYDGFTQLNEIASNNTLIWINSII